jgi:hypothetical protein
MIRSRSLTTVLILALGAAVAAAAQAPPSAAWLSGNVGALTADSITLQGLTYPVAAEAAFATVLPDGTLSEIPLASIQPGDPFHGHAVLGEAGFAWVRGYVGDRFFWHGVVTAVVRDEAGHPLTVTLDDAVTIHVSQARVAGVPPGQETSSAQDALDSPAAAEGEPYLLLEGATLGVDGLAKDGIFAAVVVNVAAVDFASTGTISSLVTGESGEVTGFVLDKNGATADVVLAPFTLIRKGRRILTPGDLEAGMRVFVTGKSLADGSVLAFEVKIAR